MKIEIFGSGCTKCNETEKKVKDALVFLNLNAEIIKIEDPLEFVTRGILLTPAVAINGIIKCTGKIPELRDLHNWITTEAINEEGT